MFNGDVGYVQHIDPAEHLLTVCFDDDRLVTYQKQQLDALELAYCLTVHKSQGSEFPVVVMPVVGGPPMLMARNHCSTPRSRARGAWWCWWAARRSLPRWCATITWPGAIPPCATA